MGGMFESWSAKVFLLYGKVPHVEMLRSVELKVKKTQTHAVSPNLLIEAAKGCEAVRLFLCF